VTKSMAPGTAAVVGLERALHDILLMSARTVPTRPTPGLPAAGPVKARSYTAPRATKLVVGPRKSFVKVVLACSPHLLTQVSTGVDDVVDNS
jgi:hypothetical protein